MDMRKIYFVILVLSFLLAGSLPAQQNAQQLFHQGNQYFQKGDYQRAVQAYQKILAEGYESGELYYNLGDAYFKMGQLGKARLFYERAKRFMPDDEALNANLKLLQRRLVDKIQKPPKFFLTDWWENFLGLFSLGLLTYLVVIFFWLFLSAWSFHLYLKKQKHRERGKGIVIVTLIIFILFSITLFDKISHVDKLNYGVILKPSVTVYSEPRKEATEIFIVHEGTEVEILRRNQGWLEIKLDDGKTGWLLANTLEKV